MTAASIITLVRILMVPLFMWTWGFHDAPWLSLCVFLVASLTDALDGYVARRYNQVTIFGKFIDPLADKLLVTAALLLFVREGSMPAAAAMIILAREFLITSLRLVAVSQGKVIAASASGKIKMVVQIVCISLLLTAWRDIVLFGSFTLGALAVWVMVAVTVWSGVVYLTAHRDLLKTPEK